MPKINKLKDLYQELNKLYTNIGFYCQKCRYEDCQGYVWLLDEEPNKLKKKGVTIVRVNNELAFLDSFKRTKNNELDLNVISPPCKLKNKDGTCSIYNNRPFICRFYPLDLKILDNKYFIVLHKNCLYIEYLCKNSQLEEFVNKVELILNNTDKKLLKSIFDYYKKVDNITNDYNNNNEIYIKLFKITKGVCMSKCKAVLDSEKVEEIKVESKEEDKEEGEKTEE